MQKEIVERINKKAESIASGFYSDIISELEELEEVGFVTSPIEQVFLIEWKFWTFLDSTIIRVWQLDPQYQDDSTAPYKIDFRLTNLLDEKLKIGIELDSHIWHEKTPNQATRDKERERFLQEHGWHLIRFTGREVWQDPAECRSQMMKIAIALLQG